MRLEFEMKRHAGQHHLVCSSDGRMRCAKCLMFGDEAANSVCHPSPVLSHLAGLDHRIEHSFMAASLKQSSRLGAPAPWEGKPIVWC